MDSLTLKPWRSKWGDIRSSLLFSPPLRIIPLSWKFSAHQKLYGNFTPSPICFRFKFMTWAFFFPDCKQARAFLAPLDVLSLLRRRYSLSGNYSWLSWARTLFFSSRTISNEYPHEWCIRLWPHQPATPYRVYSFTYMT